MFIQPSGLVSALNHSDYGLFFIASVCSFSIFQWQIHLNCHQQAKTKCEN